MNLRRPAILGLFLGLISSSASAQIFGTNLIVNGDAESGPADLSGTAPVAIPGWSKTRGSTDVLTYSSGVRIKLTAGDLAPVNGGNNYFSGGPGAPDAFSEIKQTIDLSAGASIIDGGNVTCSLSAYLGGTIPTGGLGNGAFLSIAFRDASGVGFLETNLSSVKAFKTGLGYNRTVAQVPGGARSVVVTLNFSGGDGPSQAFVDNLSLILNAPALPESMLGRNLVVNGDAESGPGSAPNALTVDVPGWQRAEVSVGAYNDPNGFQPTAVGLTNPGKNFFWGGPAYGGGSQGSQVYDVSAAAGLIDTGQITYTLSGWIGSFGANHDYTDVELFFDGWTSYFNFGNNRLGRAFLQGPFPGDVQKPKEMSFRTVTGKLPPGTRVITLTLSLQPSGLSAQPPYGLADNISLVLASTGVPSSGPAISRIVTASEWGGFTPLAWGAWIEVHGANLANTTREWKASDFNGAVPPTRLEGSMVIIEGSAIPISYVSPVQLNAYVPVALVSSPGQVDISVFTPSGSSPPFSITFNPTQPGFLAPPSFQVNGKQYVAALFSDGTTYVLPAVSVPGVTSRPAKPGEIITLYGIGFGPVTPSIPDYQVVSQQSTLAIPIELAFGTNPATLLYQGLSPGFVGLYQFSVVVPAVPDSDAVDLNFKLDGKVGRQKLVTAVHQ